MTVTNLLPDPGDYVGRDPNIEQWLNDHHTTWEYNPAIPLDTIDTAASINNQARLEPIDQEVVDRYTADMQAGHQFPPIVCHQRTTRSKKLVVIGGNHRTTAARNAGLTTLPGYTVQAEPETVLVLTLEDNRRHGLPPSETERIHQAIHLIDTGVCTQEAAAALVGVPAPKISQARSLARADRRAVTLGIGPAFAALPKTVRYHLGQIRSDPVFEQAATLTAQTGMGVAAVQTLVAAVGQAPSDVAALTIIGTEQEERRTQIQKKAGQTGKTKATARTRLSAALVTIQFTKPAEVAAACPTAAAATELAGRLKDAAQQLMTIAKAL